MRAQLIAALCGLLLATANAAPGGPLVSTTGGQARGLLQDDGVEVFRGLPFAAPPVGELRWREPQPAPPWQGVREADRFATDCVQGRLHGQPRASTPMSEDCLYLNVWKPRTPQAPLPVMVWIFGGGFQVGSANLPQYDGSRLARQGAVVIGVNYRVGNLGFYVHPALTAESPHHASGNYGILDQIAALKWVRDNAAAFGGDPDRVTVFGESAGSTAVSILQASPLAAGLFRRAIGQSTSEMDPAAGVVGRRSVAQAEAEGVRIATAVGASSLAELRALSADALAAAPFAYWPLEADGYVMPQEVHAIFAAGRQNKVDLLIGSNAQEGTTLPIPWVKPDATEAADYARLYGLAPAHQIYTDVVQWQMRTWAMLHVRSGGAAYLYWLDHAPPPPPRLLAMNGGRPLGAYHGADIPLVFGNLPPDLPWTDADRRVSGLMMAYWINFARSGDPNGPGLPTWPRQVPERTTLMRLASEPGPMEAQRMDAQLFLDKYFAKRR